MYIRSPELQYRLRQTSAADVALALGGIRSGNWYRCRCPAHGSQSMTLALRDGQDGLVIKCHRGCTKDEVVAVLDEQGLLDHGAHQERPEPTDPSESRQQALRDARWRWDRS